MKFCPCRSSKPHRYSGRIYGSVKVHATKGNGTTAHDSGCLLVMIRHQRCSKFRVCFVAELQSVAQLRSCALFHEERRILTPSFEHLSIFTSIGLLMLRMTRTFMLPKKDAYPRCKDSVLRKEDQ